MSKHFLIVTILISKYNMVKERRWLPCVLIWKNGVWMSVLKDGLKDALKVLNCLPGF